jgi:flagellar hook protein FlgE
MTHSVVMASGLGVAVSGLQAEEWQVDAAANNIANDDTPGYATERVNLQSVPGGGVTATGQQIAPPDPNGNGVDLGQQLADMMVAKGCYAADAKLISVQDQMDRSLLDVVA